MGRIVPPLVSYCLFWAVLLVLLFVCGMLVPADGLALLCAWAVRAVCLASILRLMSTGPEWRRELELEEDAFLIAARRGSYHWREGCRCGWRAWHAGETGSESRLSSD